MLAQSPFPGETGLTVIRGVSIQFDRDIVLVSFIVGKVTGPSTISPLPGVVSYDSGTHTATFSAIPGATAGGLYKAICIVQGCKEDTFIWLFQINP